MTAKESPNVNRKTATIVGVLFIIGTVSGILSAIFTGPILSDPDLLTQISANDSQIIMGSLFVLLMGFSLAMVPVMLFPIFKKYNEALALGSVVFRGALEAALYIAMVVSWLMLVILSQEYVKAGTPDAPYFQTLGALVLGASDSMNLILEMVFSLGALMIYTLFYLSRLIPRWLSGWGLIGAVLYFAAGLLAMFGVELDFLLYFLALQEMVLAVWLIVKGFNSSAFASESTI